MSDKDQNDTSKSDESGVDEDLENLSSDEKAAFEKIMSQIDTVDEKPDNDHVVDLQKNDATPSAVANQGHPAAKNEAEPNDAPAPEKPAQDDELSDDQQAALDKIMAEINGDDEKTQEPNDAPAPEKPAPDDELSDDQQAALDKIMAEIKPDVQDAASPDPLADPSGNEKSLSIEEFDDELSQLLSTSATLDQGEKNSAPPAPSTVSEKNDKPPEDKTPAERPTVTAPRLDEAQSSKASAKPKYTMLQEVVSPAAEKQSSRQRNEKKPKAGQVRRTFLTPKSIAAAILILVTALAAYWGFDKWYHGQMAPVAAINPPIQTAATTTPIVDEADNLAVPGGERQAMAAAASDPAPDQTAPTPPLVPLSAELETAQNRLEAKTKEIKALMAYYQKGVSEEQQKIESELRSSPAKSLAQALKNDRISLSVQAIQRRQVYQAKLEIPLKKLEALSEELLYLKRRTRIFNVLSKGISGLPVQDIQQEVSSAIQRQIEQSASLSIDHIDVNIPSFEQIWKEVLDDIKTKDRNLHSKAVLTGQDQQISQDICSGEYKRKSLLTALNPETAACLSQWHGKDLYLNNVDQLTPESAKALAQWNGEWLSLNGIHDLSPESAQQLALWPGKRLSLNGLTGLSRQATARLSEWNGEQLEMIGLKTIGGWKNYTTQLYLSEALQRKLQLK